MAMATANARRTGKGGPAGDDDSLWHEVMRGVRPLGKRAPPPEPEPAPEGTKKAAPARPAARAPLPEPRPPELPPLVPGQPAGIDKRTAQRLRRGQLPIEATLDLHMHTQAQAHAALDAFVTGCHDRGQRCVLVITGKGRVSRDGGVLRAEVPRWLDQAPNRARVLAVTHAQPKHGGGGALYVLLKRKR